MKITNGTGLDCFYFLLQKYLKNFGERHFNQATRVVLKLGNLFISLVEKNCMGFELASPREADMRGSQVSISHPDGYAIMQALIERSVIGDFRTPNILRFGFTPLYTRYVDVWQAVSTLAEIINSNDWRDEKYALQVEVT